MSGLLPSPTSTLSLSPASPAVSARHTLSSLNLYIHPCSLHRLRNPISSQKLACRLLNPRAFQPAFGNVAISEINGQLQVEGTDSGKDTVDGFDWEDIGFGLQPTDYMFMQKCSKGEKWVEGEVLPFGNLELSPSAAVLNYGQGLFEGLKAYRASDGRILLFRPEENAARMITGAERMSMHAPSTEQFVNAVKKTVMANRRWVPPYGKGSLYIRPLLIGSGAVLGLAPAPEYSFIIYVSPVGNYFKGGLDPIHLQVETYHHRAAPGGTGGVKTIGNYAPVLKAQLHAKGKGFSDVLYLDAVHNKYIEEVSSCNIFIVKNGEIFTPALQGSILPGITRKSILELAQWLGYKVHECAISVDDLLDADEVFCTGTAVVVNPVGSIMYMERRVEYGNGGLGEVSQLLYKNLTDIQLGKSKDIYGWVVECDH